MKNRSNLKKILILLLVGVFAISLTGCRPSPVLEQIVYRQDHEVDENTESLEQDENSEDEDEELPPDQQVADADKTEDTSQDAAVEGEEDSDAEETYSLAYSPEGEDNGTTGQNFEDTDEPNSDTGSGAEGTGTNSGAGENGISPESGSGETPADAGNGFSEEGTDSNSGAGQGGEGPGGGAGQGGEGPGEGDGSGDGSGDNGPGGNPATDPPGSTPNPDNSPDNPNGGFLPDDNNTSDNQNTPNGDNKKLPTDVHTVTAVGEAATVVEMLTNQTGRLIGASTDDISRFRENGIFTQDVDNIQGWWSGNGSTPISDENFAALLGAHPEVCVATNGQALFDEGQLAQLDAEGIEYVVLPAFDSIEDIEEIVTDVGGTMLADDTSGGGTDPGAVAKNYCSWAEGVINTAQSGRQTDDRYTLCLDWNGDVTWMLRDPQSGNIYDYGENNENKGAAIAKTNSLLQECMEYVGLTNTADLVSNSNGAFVTPIQNNKYLQYIDNKSINYSRLTAVSEDVYLGNNPSFTSVIAANKEAAQTVQAHPLWAVGTFSQGWHPNSISKVWNIDYTDDGLNPIETTIHGDYKIYTNPSGVGDWMDGSVESPLEAEWLAYTQGAPIDITSDIETFYHDFYNVKIDGNSVLNGE